MVDRIAVYFGHALGDEGAHGGDRGFVLLEEVLEVDGELHGEVWAVGLVWSIFWIRNETRFDFLSIV